VTRTPRRRVGCLVGSVIAVVVLVGGPVLADRVTHGYAEDVAADAVRSRLSATDADVRIEGFPFLTQFARGTLRDVHLRASSASIQGLDVVDLEVAATEVAVRGTQGAARVRATATVPPEALQALLRERTGWGDLTVTLEDGTVLAGGALVGVPVSVALTIAPAGEAGITATVVGASLAGFQVDAAALPDGIADRLAGLSVAEDLPAGSRVTGATVAPDGLHLVVEADDVTVDQL
jgi:hypothetical protein